MKEYLILGIFLDNIDNYIHQCRLSKMRKPFQNP